MFNRNKKGKLVYIGGQPFYTLNNIMTMLRTEDFREDLDRFKYEEVFISSSLNTVRIPKVSSDKVGEIQTGTMDGSDRVYIIITYIENYLNTIRIICWDYDEANDIVDKLHCFYNIKPLGTTD